jgi:hypothetical protein
MEWETMTYQNSEEAGKLMDLGRRLLQTVHWLHTPIADVLTAPEQLAAQDLAKATKIATTAAERIASWYPQVSPELGAFLLDPNVVLTLGDARGHTEFSAWGTSQDIGKLNVLGAQVGIRFNIDNSVEPEKIRDLFVGITSRVGLEAVTAASKLPGLPKFLAESDDSPWLWYKRAFSEIDALPDRELTSEDQGHITFGVMKGYPDKAVLALLTLDRELWRSTKLKCANFYNCAQPNFDYNPLDAEGVVEQANIWGEALSQFYKSSVHLEIKSQDAFVRVRLRQMDETMRWYFDKNPFPPAEAADGPIAFDRMLLDMNAWRKMATRFLD